MSEDNYRLLSFWRELKRRKVIHVIVVYATAAFFIIELVNNVYEPLRLPDWTPLLFIVILAIGFPVAIIISWMFDISLKGVTRTEPARHKNARSKSGELYESHPVQEKSIIVLPFENISPDPDQEYFSDGLTEEIITDLSHIHDLLVISRNSAMTFKGSRKPTKEIAEKANVRYVLEGSVRKAGNNLRITAQLIDASNDSHLWAEKYSGTLDDVFDIQEKVSRSIVATLKSKLSVREDKTLSDHQIDNYQAYEYYLKSNAEIFKLSEGSIRNAIENLHQAVDIIGDNALLYTSMALAYFQLVNIGVEQEDYLIRGIEYVKKALILHPDHPKAIATFGFLQFLKSHETLKSVHYLKKALAISPDDTDALKYLAVLYIYFVGNIPAATTICERVMKLDPFDFLSNVNQKSLSFYDGRFERALADWQRLYEMYPDNLYMHFWYALILVYNEMFEKAFTIVDKCVKKDPGNLYTKLSLMLKFMCLNDKENAVNIMTSDLIETCRRDATYSHHIAGFFAMLNDKPRALDWIEDTVDHGFINYPLLAERDPFLENIRGEERFRKLMKRVKYEWENFEV